MPMASIVSTVSRNDSPFFTAELATASDNTSADSRLAAVSKESRVRVDSSKNSVATTFPRRVGTLGIERRSTSANASATRSTSAIPSAPRSATDNRWGPMVVRMAGSVWVGSDWVGSDWVWSVRLTWPPTSRWPRRPR